MESILKQINWAKQSNLIPTITQDINTKEVLMLAYSNEESLRQTLQSNLAHYYSRSKNRIWQKGETSQNIQIIKEIRLDCDDDSLLFLVEQKGVACHTGEKSCFFKKIDTQGIEKNIESKASKEKINYNFMDTLYHTILERKSADPKVSYVASLFKKGENTICKKIVEEAGELCFAIKDKDKEQIVYECADLVFHALVGLAKEDIHPEQIESELKRREGLSGIAEKNSRKE